MKIFNNTETRNYTEEEAEMLISTLPGFTGTPHNYVSAKAIENSDVFTIVNLLSSDVASLDVNIMKNNVTATDDITRLLNVAPNGNYSGGTIKFIITANALINGQSFVEIIRDQTGEVMALSHLPNSIVSIVQGKDTKNKIMYDVASSDGKVRRIKPENMLHFKFFTLDGVRGVSPLIALKDDLSTQQDSKRFLANFFRNDTQTGGILKMKQGKLSKEARDKIREEWQKSNAGVGQAHKVLVVDDTFDYKPIEVDTEILKLINASTFSTETIGKVYRIPRHKLGLETSNMSLAQANIDYLTSTLNSYLKVITNELNYKLVDGNNDKYAFDTAPFKTVDIETLTKITLEKLEKGVISVNEARIVLGDAPKNDEMFDKHYVSLNFTTLDQLEEYQMKKAASSRDLPPSDN